MLCLYILVYYLLLPEISGKQIEIKCPQHCKCDILENFRRATCTNRNVVRIESNFPEQTQILDLSYNQINHLEEYVFKEEKLLSLKLLNMSHNKLSDIHMRAFDGMTELKTLDLSYNGIQYILKNWFVTLKSLEELYLKGNSFSRLTDGVKFSSESLKRLDLSACHTAYIAPDTFLELPNLENLDISDNYIIGLSINVIKPLENLVILNATNTKLTCNGEFEKLLDYCKQKGIRFTHPCATKQKNQEEKFQRMINAEPPEDEKNSWIYDDKEKEINVDNGTKIMTECNNTRVVDKSLLQEIVDLSPVLSILLPFIYGISVGVLISYTVHVCSTKKKKNLDESTYMSFDDGDSHLQRRRTGRLRRLSARFDRSYSTEERQQLPLREWKLSESTPVLFRKNQVQL